MGRVEENTAHIGAQSDTRENRAAGRSSIAEGRTVGNPWQIELPQGAGETSQLSFVMGVGGP